MRKEDVVFSRRVRVALAQSLVRSDSAFKRVRNTHARLAIADGNEQPLRLIRNRDVVVFESVKLRCHRPHERVHSEEDEVIQLFGDGNATDDDTLRGKGLGACEQLFVFVVGLRDQRMEAKEGAGIVSDGDARRIRSTSMTPSSRTTFMTLRKAA